jgi:hypothetical protein
MPTQAHPGQRADDATPATFSARANEAPPLKKPNGWRFRSSTFIFAKQVSTSGVEINSIPRAVLKFGFALIISTIFSTFTLNFLILKFLHFI